MSKKIEHVIVLMLENRSFDHMLGYLDHPSLEKFPGLTGDEKIPRSDSNGNSPMVEVTNKGKRSIIRGPGHHFKNVMRQLGCRKQDDGSFSKPDNRGFVADYEDVLRKKEKEKHHQDVVACLTPGKIPVLAMLAREFAVCTRWFCSVPGMTWPNRNYLHSGTSEGEVDITLRKYTAKTIFSLLYEAKKSWKVFHDGFSHVKVFKEMHRLAFWGRFKKIKKLHLAIKYDTLPAYSFVEPDHFGRNSNSQHPRNNEDEEFNRKDFFRAEELIAEIYNGLQKNPKVFKKTLFVVTYDEHGGFFDREPPPSRGENNPNPVVPPDDEFNKKHGFHFDMLGPRVPAVLVSPWIPEHTIDHTLYDHTSVLKTLCEIFDLDPGRLRNRVPKANSFTHYFSAGATLRIGLPVAEPKPYVKSPTFAPELDKEPTEPEFDEFHDAMVDLAVELKLELEHLQKSDAESFAATSENDLKSQIVERRSQFANGFEEEEFTHEVMDAIRAHSEKIYFELETTEGELVDMPSAEQIENALAEILASGDARSEMTLTDGLDRSLTINGEGGVRYLDLDSEEQRSGRETEREILLEMLTGLHNRNVEPIRTRLEVVQG